MGAARLINQYGAIEHFPETVLAERRPQALLFKDLATLRTDAALFRDVEEMRWRGSTKGFYEWTVRLGDARLWKRCEALERDPTPFPEKGS